LWLGSALIRDGDLIERSDLVQEVGGLAREAKIERTSLEIEKGEQIESQTQKMSKP
jgi:hypothetical protein